METVRGRGVGITAALCEGQTSWDLKKRSWLCRAGGGPSRERARPIPRASGGRGGGLFERGWWVCSGIKDEWWERR